MYGKSLASATDNDLSYANLLVETPEILKVREELDKKEATKIALSAENKPK